MSRRRSASRAARRADERTWARIGRSAPREVYRRWMCAHEAAHAVAVIHAAAWLDAVEVQDVPFRAAGTPAVGAVRWSALGIDAEAVARRVLDGGAPPSPLQTRALYASALVSLAGAFGEALAGRPATRAYGPDHAGALLCARALARAGMEPDAATVYAEIERAAEHLVLREQPRAVLALADVLYERGRLDGEEATRIIEEHWNGPVPPRAPRPAAAAMQVAAMPLTARDADGGDVRIWWRVVAEPSDSYTALGLLGPVASHPTFQPQPLTVSGISFDRDRAPLFLEAWAEDEDGNRSGIARRAIPALENPDAAIATAAASTTLGSTCPSNLDDTITWTLEAEVPSTWRVEVWILEGTNTGDPFSGVRLSANATSPFTTRRIANVRRGASSTYRRIYGLRLLNSYGRVVTERNVMIPDTGYEPCPV